MTIYYFFKDRNKALTWWIGANDEHGVFTSSPTRIANLYSTDAHNMMQEFKKVHNINLFVKLAEYRDLVNLGITLDNEADEAFFLLRFCNGIEIKI